MTLPTVKPGTILVIGADGGEATIPAKPTIRTIETLMGADTLEFVRIGRLEGTDLVMAVDDKGYQSEMVQVGDGHFALRPVKALKPVNAKATEFYHAICQPGTTHEIVGDVAICHDEDFA